MNASNRGPQERPSKPGAPSFRGQAGSSRRGSSERRGLRQKIQPIPTGADRFPDGSPYSSIPEEDWKAIMADDGTWQGGTAWKKTIPGHPLYEGDKE